MLYPNISQQMEWDQSTNSYFYVLHAFKLQSRKAVMALYPAETRYPKTPWTTALLLMTLIALLSIRNVLVASGLSWLRMMAQKLGVSASILLAAQAGATFSSGLQFTSTLLATMLLGRAVEVTMGGPILFSTFAACLSRCSRDGEGRIHEQMLFQIWPKMCDFNWLYKGIPMHTCVFINYNVSGCFK